MIQSSLSLKEGSYQALSWVQLISIGGYRDPYRRSNLRDEAFYEFLALSIARDQFAYELFI